jgi:hypothetical protein
MLSFLMLTACGTHSYRWDLNGKLVRSQREVAKNASIFFAIHERPSFLLVGT